MSDLCDALGIALAVQLIGSFAAEPSPAPIVFLSKAKLRRVLEHINGHWAEGVTMAEIAAACGLRAAPFIRVCTA